MYSSAQNSVSPQVDLPVRLTDAVKIGGATLPNRVFLAPMSGVTDVPFRNLATQAGAGLVVSEMVASQELVKGSRESNLRSERGKASIYMVQLAGREAYWMGEAARMLAANGADIIDINMGCPAKKVTGGLSGSALMRDLDHAMTLIEATVAAVSVPVTLKMRLGWDEKSINAPDLARRAVNAGVQMITVHGRTRCQFYEDKADWRAIRAVRDAVDVPLVVNGDIGCTEVAYIAMAQSGADAVMVGRAHYGQPWLSGVLGNADLGSAAITAPEDLGAYVVAHYEAMLTHYGSRAGNRHARKHLAAYIDRHAPHVSTDVRSAILKSDHPTQVMKNLHAVFSGVAIQSSKVAA